MAAEDGGVTDGRTNLIPNVVKDGSWHQHAGKHTEPSLFSLIAGLKGLAEVNQKPPDVTNLCRPWQSLSPKTATRTLTTGTTSMLLTHSLVQTQMLANF